MISGPGAAAAGHEELIERVAALAREKFAGRADRYDREAIFPADDFEDLFAAGLHAPCVPESFGGQGLGPGHDVYALWLMTKEIAKADMSMARCWEGHVNSQVLIDAFGTEEQKRRWFEGIADGREIWVAWSGEPQSRIPGQKARFGTNVTRVEGGYLVDGTKVFATSAGHAHQAILLVDIAGPGGARHAAGASGGVLLLVCDLAENTVTFDDSWWDPIGMRATVSYLARFDRCFIPDRDVLGQPGQYLAEGWQTRFAPHYGATFLGGAEAAFEYAHAYATKDEREPDPYVEQRLGQMSLNIECAHLYLEHVSRLWDAGRSREAMRAGIRARFLVEKWAAETVDYVIKACGARSLIRPSPIERIYRDLSIYARHDNADHLLATIGREALGKIHDVSFFHLEERPTPSAASNGQARTSFGEPRHSGADVEG
jgi:alkylation response protein AidB-like acyl-CoA dehydrogenase